MCSCYEGTPAPMRSLAARRTLLENARMLLKLVRDPPGSVLDPGGVDIPIPKLTKDRGKKPAALAAGQGVAGDHEEQEDALPGSQRRRDRDREREGRPRRRDRRPPVAKGDDSDQGEDAAPPPAGSAKRAPWELALAARQEKRALARAAEEGAAEDGGAGGERAHGHPPSGRGPGRPGRKPKLPKPVDVGVPVGDGDGQEEKRQEGDVPGGVEGDVGQQMAVKKGKRGALRRARGGGSQVAAREGRGDVAVTEGGVMEVGDEAGEGTGMAPVRKAKQVAVFGLAMAMCLHVSYAMQGKKGS
eukprot:jgi/Mesvir1/4804/Mv11098-RA.1